MSIEKPIVLHPEHVEILEAFETGGPHGTTFRSPNLTVQLALERHYEKAFGRDAFDALMARHGL